MQTPEAPGPCDGSQTYQATSTTVCRERLGLKELIFPLEESANRLVGKHRADGIRQNAGGG